MDLDIAMEMMACILCSEQLPQAQNEVTLQHNLYFILHFILCSMLYALCSMLYALCSMLYTLCSILPYLQSWWWWHLMDLKLKYILKMWTCSSFCNVGGFGGGWDISINIFTLLYALCSMLYALCSILWSKLWLKQLKVQKDVWKNLP